MDSPDPVIYTHVTPAQLRAARALLDWSRDRAALECGIGRATLGRMERDERVPRSSTMDGVIGTFESHGVRFFRNGNLACVAIEDTTPATAAQD